MIKKKELNWEENGKYQNVYHINAMNKELEENANEMPRDCAKGSQLHIIDKNKDLMHDGEGNWYPYGGSSGGGGGVTPEELEAEVKARKEADEKLLETIKASSEELKKFIEKKINEEDIKINKCWNAENSGQHRAQEQEITYKTLNPESGQEEFKKGVFLQTGSSPVPPPLPEVKEHLDMYTLDELKSVAIDLSKNESRSKFYSKFQDFILNENEIWWSNSNCNQECNLIKDKYRFDPTKANQKYKCGFTYPDGSIADDKENFIGLKIVDILHDTKPNGTKAGITFTMTSSLPTAHQMDANQKNIWTQSELFKKLQPNGEIYESFNYEISKWIEPVVKLCQNARTEEPTIEKQIHHMFLPSYSELWAKDNAFEDIKWLDHNSKSVDNAKSEGYTYAFSWQFGVSGMLANEILALLRLTNKLDAPINKTYQAAYLRSPFVSKDDKFLTNCGGGKINELLSLSEYLAVTPMFCY